MLPNTHICVFGLHRRIFHFKRRILNSPIPVILLSFLTRESTEWTHARWLKIATATVPWSETQGLPLAAPSTRKDLCGHAVSLASVPVWARIGLACCLVEIGSAPCLSGHPAILIDGYECRHARGPVCTSDLGRRISAQKYQNSQLCWVPEPGTERRWYQCHCCNSELDLFLNAPNSWNNKEGMGLRRSRKGQGYWLSKEITTIGQLGYKKFFSSKQFLG